MSALAQVQPSPTPDLARIGRALISVSDKDRLVEFGRFLAAQGVEILSTGGSAKALRDAGIKVVEVSDHTGFPEIMDGRVKTLQPSIHGGILGRRTDAGHQKAMTDHRIAPIDLVVVNLYPFEATVARGADYATCVENIDIGGPALIRASAKNHDFVAIAVDPQDYAAIREEMQSNGGATTLALRRRLAAKAYARTAAYDSAIANWFARQQGEVFPERLSIAATRVQTLRYGENPHQQAPSTATAATVPASPPRAWSRAGALLQQHRRHRGGVQMRRRVQGASRRRHQARQSLRRGDRPRPVQRLSQGLCLRSGIDFRRHRRRQQDTRGAYGRGSRQALPRGRDRAGCHAEALEILGRRKNVRVLLAGTLPDPTTAGMTLKSVAGGYLFQTRDNGKLGRDDLKVVTKRAPSAKELDDLLFAFTVCKHVKSNAIVYAKDGATVGVGAGQMNRRDSSRIAAIRAAESGEIAKLAQSPAVGSVVASDAFFPFADGLLAAAEAGATAIIQPGGSMRDKEVIEAADEKGLAMVFTGMRHFRH